jgi:hypothetical protein
MSDGQDVAKPELVIFSSGKVADSGVTDAIRDELKRRGFYVTPWMEGFFPTNEIALNRFIKQLLCYDAALVVLGDDDIRLDPTQPGKQQHVPRDNVIFELGACMSRLGPKKTFIIRPETPEVVLPSYFHGVGGHLTYETGRVDGNLNAAVGSACSSVAREFANFDPSAFFSDLPASGLAHGYYHNFLMPVYRAFAAGTPTLSGKDSSTGSRWDPKNGFKLTVLIPDKPLDRKEVQDFFTGGLLILPAVFTDGRMNDNKRRAARRRINFEKLELTLLDGRNISIYAKKDVKDDDPFEILDVPTTLLTSQAVIAKVDAFWGAGDLTFKNRLVHREALNFQRTLLDLTAASGEINIVPMAKFEKDAFEF